MKRMYCLGPGPGQCEVRASVHRIRKKMSLYDNGQNLKNLMHGPAVGLDRQLGFEGKEAVKSGIANLPNQ